MTATAPIVSALYAGVLGLLAQFLAIVVIRGRRRHGVGLGDGGRDDLGRAIRTFGNFSEYVPLLLVMLGMLEALGTQQWMIHAGGVVLVLARLTHARALMASSGPAMGRVVGMASTFAVLILSSVGLIYAALRAGALG